MQRRTAWRELDASARGASVALGNFDGVHLGHQAVLEAARLAGEHAKGGPSGARLGVIVFSPHPRRFFQPNAEPFRLTSDAKRAEILAGLGVAELYELAFDRDLSLMDADAFAREVLAEGLGAAHVTIGFDYRFGRDRVGDADALKRLGALHGFGVSVVEPVNDGANKCSSSAIREALRAGDTASAERMLTRPWSIDGVVERGDQRGRTIGFPTANVPLGALVRPRLGVYAIQARIDGRGEVYGGVANIGSRPTFDGEDVRLEAHLFDFDADIYGLHVDVAPRAFVRPEQKFSGLDALKDQIARDAASARAALAQAD